MPSELAALPPLSLPVGVSVGHASQPLMKSVELAERIEALGVDFVTVGDSGAETFGMLGAVASRTTSLGLMSGIATWSRSPVTMAHAAQTIHNLSGGRYTLGIGPMPKAWATQYHGLAFDPVVGRMREYLTAVRACLDAEADHPTDVDGQYFPTHGFPGHAMTPPRRVPMMMAATLPAMVRTAVELTDGPMLNSIHPWEWLTQTAPGLFDEGLTRGGKTRADITVGIMRFCAIDDDREAAYDHVRRAIAFYFPIPYLRTLLEPFGYDAELAAGEAALAAGDKEGMVAAVSDRMVEAIGIAGTAAEVLARVQEYAEHVDWMQLVGTMNVAGDAAYRQTVRLAELAGAARTAARTPATIGAS